MHNADQFLLPGIVAVVPPAPSKKPHYSYSAVESAKCGQRYYYKRVEKLEEAKTYNLVAGSIMDNAFNAYYENNEHLRESHQQRLDYARAATDQLLSDNASWFTMPWSARAGDVRSSPDNYVAWLFDCNALELVCRQDRGPVEVQKKVSIETDKYFIDGYIDCLELNTNTIVDVKSVAAWGGEVSILSYALRSQVPLYRMLLNDSEGRETKGRYELVLCRKTPKLVSVDDPDIAYLQEKLVKDFDEHHRKVTTKNFTRNPDQCLVYNKACAFLGKCWPELAHVTNQPAQS